MRNLRALDAYRITDRAALTTSGGWAGDETCGAFVIPSIVDRAKVCVIASVGEGWDHVSVSRRNRCPNWAEMEQVASLFFKDDEVAMQLHVLARDHVNNHPYCLHWWRPIDGIIPRPPPILVGVKSAGVLTPETAEKLAAEVLSAYP